MSATVDYLVRGGKIEVHEVRFLPSHLDFEEPQGARWSLTTIRYEDFRAAWGTTPREVVLFEAARVVESSGSAINPLELGDLQGGPFLRAQIELPIHARVAYTLKGDIVAVHEIEIRTGGVRSEQSNRGDEARRAIQAVIQLIDSDPTFGEDLGKTVRELLATRIATRSRSESEAIHLEEARLPASPQAAEDAFVQQFTAFAKSHPDNVRPALARCHALAEADGLHDAERRLRLSDAVRITGLSQARIYQLAEQGVLGEKLPKGGWRFSEAELYAYRDQERKPGPKPAQ
ncbi:MAG: hypothetical protein BGO49_31160 [Planctomycetales bacterium 71-10]|nr:MAG: hypothetical protein BGO49_31160 [Planctomycetales bacterium 71-10]